MVLLKQRWFRRTLVTLVTVVALACVAVAVGPRIARSLAQKDQEQSGHGHQHNAADGHDHEEPKVAATVWSNGVELFIDHDYMVAGEPV